MAEEKLLTIREVSLLLGISEKEVIELAEKQVLPAYKIGGVYLRFKRQQIEDFKRHAKQGMHKNNPAHKSLLWERFSDFFYFNDFYIVSALLVILILLIIFRGF